jgi:hypothetical protein
LGVASYFYPFKRRGAAICGTQDLAVRTTTQNNTLAPRWSEHFELNVYRPESRLLRLFRLGDDRDDRAPVVAFLGGLKLEEWYIKLLYFFVYIRIYMYIYI